jgi:hypothetical protein
MLKIKEMTEMEMPNELKIYLNQCVEMVKSHFEKSNLSNISALDVENFLVESVDEGDANEWFVKLCKRPYDGWMKQLKIWMNGDNFQDVTLFIIFWQNVHLAEIGTLMQHFDAHAKYRQWLQSSNFSQAVLDAANGVDMN